MHLDSCPPPPTLAAGVFLLIGPRDRELRSCGILIIVGLLGLNGIYHSEARPEARVLTTINRLSRSVFRNRTETRGKSGLPSD